MSHIVSLPEIKLEPAAPRPAADEQASGLAQLQVIGLNHRTASVTLRERYAQGTEAFHSALAAIRASALEVVAVSTCNRSEWIVFNASPDLTTLTDPICRAAGLDPADFQRNFYAYSGRDALRHLFRVASGLDSLIPGETQILGQLKQAFGCAFESDLAGPRLMRVYHHILRTAKAVRTQTAIGEKALSYGTLSVQVARESFPDLAERRVLLVGAGKMSKLVATHFREAGVTRMRILNRDPQRGLALAELLQAERCDMAFLNEALVWADVVVTSTACPHCFITPPVMAEIQAARGDRPLCLIDLAVPRNIEPLVADCPHTRLLNVDDLERLIASNRADRMRCLDAAELLVTEHVDAIVAAARADIGPVVTALQTRAAAVRDAELDRLFRRNEHLSAADREAIAQSTRLIVNRLLHDPIRGLRETIVSHTDQGQIMHLFRQWFNLPEMTTATDLIDDIE